MLSFLYRRFRHSENTTAASADRKESGCTERRERWPGRDREPRKAEALCATEGPLKGTMVAGSRRMAGWPGLVLTLPLVSPALPKACRLTSVGGSMHMPVQLRFTSAIITDGACHCRGGGARQNVKEAPTEYIFLLDPLNVSGPGALAKQKCKNVVDK